MAEKQIICIICPQGCAILVNGDENNISSMIGQNCTRGEVYARDEFTHPLRVLTSTVKVTGSNVPLVAVRTNKPIPKKLLFRGMDEIRKIQVAAPINRGNVIIHNFLDTGADLIATGEVY